MHHLLEKKRREQASARTSLRPTLPGSKAEGSCSELKSQKSAQGNAEKPQQQQQYQKLREKRIADRERGKIGSSPSIRNHELPERASERLLQREEGDTLMEVAKTQKGLDFTTSARGVGGFPNRVSLKYTVGGRAYTAHPWVAMFFK
ncbi:hypothetical protein ACLOJK_009300 [Asimina triloba]